MNKTRNIRIFLLVVIFAIGVSFWLIKDSALVDEKNNQVSSLQTKQELILPVDSSVDSISLYLIFRPKKPDQTYDLFEATGGQNFYFTSGDELSKAPVAMMLDPDGEIISFTQGGLEGTERAISLVDPEGREFTTPVKEGEEVFEWAAGKFFRVTDPFVGEWKIRFSGEGEYSFKAIAGSDTSIVDWDYTHVVLGREGLMTSPLTGEEVLAPIIGTVYPMEITIGGNTLGATAPRVVAVDLEMQELSEGELLGWVPDDFLTDLYVLMKIPDQPFRYSVEWTDAEGEKIRRMDGRIFVPNKGKSSVTDKDVDYFRETFSPY